MKHIADYFKTRSGACLLAGSGPSLRLLRCDIAEDELPVVCVNASVTQFQKVSAWLSTEPTPELMLEAQNKSIVSFVSNWAHLSGDPMNTNLHKHPELKEPVWFDTKDNTVGEDGFAYNPVGGSGMPSIHMAAFLGFNPVIMIGMDFGQGSAQYFNSKQVANPHMYDYYRSMATGNAELIKQISERYGTRFINMSFQSPVNEACDARRIPDKWRKEGVELQQDLEPYQCPVCPIMGTGRCAQGIYWKTRNCQIGNCKFLMPMDWVYDVDFVPTEPTEPMEELSL